MQTPKTILLVEDDRVDVMTVKRALKDSSINNPLVVVGNGEEALEYLNENRKMAPIIIILDLNMPKMNGIEFLKIAKKDPCLRRIPVVVLTTSKADEDKVNSFDLHVAGYMLKPVQYKQFVDVMGTIHKYWSISELANWH